MGSRANVDWVKSNEDRYITDERALAAAQRVLAARAAAQMGEPEVALRMYLGAARMWKGMEDVQPGMWSKEVKCTRDELSRFGVGI